MMILLISQEAMVLVQANRIKEALRGDLGRTLLPTQVDFMECLNTTEPYKAKAGFGSSASDTGKGKSKMSGKQITHSCYGGLCFCAIRASAGQRIRFICYSIWVMMFQTTCSPIYLTIF